MAGSGGSLKELANRYNALIKPVYQLGQNLQTLKRQVERMNRYDWNGGQTANKWYEDVRKAYNSDRNFYNKMIRLQRALSKKIVNLATKTKVNVTVKAPSGPEFTQVINYANSSADDIYIDVDVALTDCKNIKANLQNMCNELQKMKANLDALVNSGALKGKVKKTLSKVANGVNKRYNKTKAVKGSLESSLSKSIADYVQATAAFDELDSLAEDLNN